MQKQELEAFRQQLLTQRQQLLSRIAEQRGGAVSRAEMAAEHFEHPEDSPAQVASAKDLEFAINEHETAELNAMDAALARLSDGSYGECTDCGLDIAPERLKAQPEAARCIYCQEKAERRV